ncbi:hypothetical protein I4F81_000206 [Pyropia yezoensis]|uniref:Uncharacterized protein n=1 Tax=Pyropia yezoensis TaxID=2788 RepID=A0ACC3BI55_PYRYE|nr:hypothetical protein I4F81_000206 [Neopyropia yezoensis]
MAMERHLRQSHSPGSVWQIPLGRAPPLAEHPLLLAGCPVLRLVAGAAVQMPRAHPPFTSIPPFGLAARLVDASLPPTRTPHDELGTAAAFRPAQYHLLFNRHPTRGEDGAKLVRVRDLPKVHARQRREPWLEPRHPAATASGSVVPLKGLRPVEAAADAAAAAAVATAVPEGHGRS